MRVRYNEPLKEKENLLRFNGQYGSIFFNKSDQPGMVMLVRLYAHYAAASFLHKFAQALPSRYLQRYMAI